jgi:hypothetical protein
MRVLTEDRPTILSELHPTQLERASGKAGDDFLLQMRGLGYATHALENGTIGTILEHAPADAVVSVVFVPT